MFVIPLKAFDAAKGRLAGHLTAPERARLAEATASHVVRTCTATGAGVAVVTADAAVGAWAIDLGCIVVGDPGRGLDAAVQAGVEAADGSAWCVVHGDLPLLTIDDLVAVLEASGPATAVLSPSRDGGTNLLSASEPVAFSYGRSSFSRHLLATSHLERRVIATAGTVVDVDGPDDLIRAAALPAGAWLRPYLGSAS